MGRTDRAGTYFAGYRIDALLGEGGMGQVYRAENPRLGTWLALKILAADLSRSEQFRERFVRESRAAASLDHPNVIPIFDADEEDGIPFIAMRYVEGRDLKALMEDAAPLPVDRALALLGQVAEALDWAHAHDVVHRDVKPANILIESRAGREHVYLSDFGVAKLALGRGLTSTGEFVGTIEYVAPEQITSKDVDGRADVYALGCILYECLTGSPPYDRDSSVSLMYAHLEDEPPSVTATRRELPPPIDDVLRRALAKSRDDRYPRASDLVAAAATALGAEPLAPSPPTIETVVRRRPGTESPEARELEGPAEHESAIPVVEAVVVDEAPSRAPGTVVSTGVDVRSGKAPAPQTVLSRLPRPRAGRASSRRALAVVAGVVVLTAAAVGAAQAFRGDSRATTTTPGAGAGAGTVPASLPPPPVPVEPPAAVVSCIVPPLRGATVLVASRRVASGDCRVGRIGRAYSGTVARGRVIRQNPRAGRRLREGARVDLIVSAGAPPPPPPPAPAAGGGGSPPPGPPPPANCDRLRGCGGGGGGRRWWRRWWWRRWRRLRPASLLSGVR